MGAQVAPAVWETRWGLECGTAAVSTAALEPSGLWSQALSMKLYTADNAFASSRSLARNCRLEAAGVGEYAPVSTGVRVPALEGQLKSDGELLRASPLRAAVAHETPPVHASRLTLPPAHELPAFITAPAAQGGDATHRDPAGLSFSVGTSRCDRIAIERQLPIPVGEHITCGAGA